MQPQRRTFHFLLCALFALPACGDDASGDAESSTESTGNTEGTESTSESTNGDSTSGDGDSTSGDSDSTSGDGDSTSGDGDSTSGDGDSDPTTTGDGDGDCEPVSDDASAIGNMCDPEDPSSCPAGYVCGENTGIVLTHNCRIECSEDCECPDGTTCESMSDKAATWMECRP